MYADVDLARHTALATTLGPLLDGARAVEYFSEDGHAYDRRGADGLATLRVTRGEQAFGVVVNDFRLRGGSFGTVNSRRLSAFFDEAAAAGLPLVVLVDSMGVRLTEGRAVSASAFGTLPALMRCREQQLLVTCNLGRALGLGAVLLGAGHYRMAVPGTSTASLAGPDVMRMFFGHHQQADPEPALTPDEVTGTLVIDTPPTRMAMLERAAWLMGVACRLPIAPAAAPRPSFPALGRAGRSDSQLAAILAGMADTSTEVFPRLSGTVRAYVATRDERHFGLLVNPPGHLDNLLTAAALDKYILALDLFRALRLPVVSLLDTPGGDPRDHSEVILKLWTAARRVVAYPHGLMGICIGRGFGGAVMLGFPRFLGSTATYVLEGANLGVMHATFVDTLLAEARPLAGEWTAARAAQTADCADLVAAGAVDAVLRPDEVLPALDRFLAGPLPSGRR